MKKITIKDIASEAGVTPTTVSYVLNGRLNKVSAQTVERIREVMRELNYVPNYSARTLVEKRIETDRVLCTIQ